MSSGRDGNGHVASKRIRWAGLNDQVRNGRAEVDRRNGRRRSRAARVVQQRAVSGRSPVEPDRMDCLRLAEQGVGRFAGLSRRFSQRYFEDNVRPRDELAIGEAVINRRRGRECRSRGKRSQDRAENSEDTAPRCENGPCASVVDSCRQSLSVNPSHGLFSISKRS